MVYRKYPPAICCARRVAKGTELGLRAKAAMDAGKLVDDATVLGMIRERLSRPDAAQGLHSGWLSAQHRPGRSAARRCSRTCGTPLEAVVLLNLDLGILFKRLTGRRICETCGQVFNIYTSPPGDADRECGDKPHRLIQRPDDKEEVIGKRLEVYEAQTKPLIKHYETAGLLRVVDADADVDTVFKSIQKPSAIGRTLAGCRAVGAGLRRDIQQSRADLLRRQPRQRVRIAPAHGERLQLAARRQNLRRSLEVRRRAHRRFCSDDRSAAFCFGVGRAS